MPRRIAVLGSTGSIGEQALRIIAESPGLELHSIYCGSSLNTLIDQIRRYSPSLAGIARLPGGSSSDRLLVGPEHLGMLVNGSDMVLNAIVGSAGLKASLIVQEQGLPLALANKESLVIGGELLNSHLEKGLVIPVDSEHSTVFRCLQGERRTPRKILLTASGGALRNMTLSRAATASVEQVLAHPNWNMGARITVDSATLVNKAFEVIESLWLFPGIPTEAVIHPESVVHSFVQTADGAWKALLGLPDMAVPISFALHWPDLDIPVRHPDETPLDWGPLSFCRLDPERYPAYTAVLSSHEAGGTAPAAANAADEAAVEGFIAGRIPFGSIALVIDQVLKRHQPRPLDGYETLLEADREAREHAEEIMEEI